MNACHDLYDDIIHIHLATYSYFTSLANVLSPEHLLSKELTRKMSFHLWLLVCLVMSIVQCCMLLIAVKSIYVGHNIDDPIYRLVWYRNQFIVWPYNYYVFQVSFISVVSRDVASPGIPEHHPSLPQHQWIFRIDKSFK